MPTLITKKLSDLQVERESFRRYEQQIIQERDMILTSVRGHLAQLDRDIERLGGSPRAAKSEVDSSAPSDQTLCSPVAVLSPGNKSGSQKKRGRPKKEKFPSSDKSDALSAERNSRIQDVEGEANRLSGSKIKSKGMVVTGNNSIGEAWTCECGKHMSAGRARCGACRRWKGGKRLTRWTIKPKDSNTSNEVVGADVSSSSLSCGTSTVFNAYKNMPPAEQQSALEAPLLATMSSGTTNNPRLEIEEIMRTMVSAVDFVVANTQTSNKIKQGRPNKNPAVSTSDSDEGSVVKPPRQRGRPKKQDNSTPGMPAGKIERIASG
ncbi:hypothetical protein ACHAWU_008726 [Discostella pseudostelligera]|uniref:Uncharacterized protein n=1 Tax=Discostella pseudostelligera TaxID=259834 RepID=A0ABD3M653_9STRA